MHVWSVSCLPQKKDELLAQLSALDPTRLVVTRVPGKKHETVQFFAETRVEAIRLQKVHQGTVDKVTDAWKTPLAEHPPIRIRDRFIVLETSRQPRDPRELLIPAGLAFGTGDHPTTASCLRLLCDIAAPLSRKGKWSLLDAGTGSGLLAITARKLGASPVAAFDYDPLSISTARANARLNAVRGIAWTQQDLLAWKPAARFDVVTANIFSELFLASWPRLRLAVQPNGYFILSGILRFQAADCRAVLEQSHFVILREVRLGKWVTFLAQSDRK